MKVKIRNQMFDSLKEPIMIIFSEHDKVNISLMPKDFNKYCGYPDEGYSKEQIEVFMELSDEKIESKENNQLLLFN